MRRNPFIALAGAVLAFAFLPGRSRTQVAGPERLAQVADLPLPAAALPERGGAAAA